MCIVCSHKSHALVTRGNHGSLQEILEQVIPFLASCIRIQEGTGRCEAGVCTAYTKPSSHTCPQSGSNRKTKTDHTVQGRFSDVGTRSWLLQTVMLTALSQTCLHVR